MHHNSHRDNYYLLHIPETQGFWDFFMSFVATLSQIGCYNKKILLPYSVAVLSKSLHNESDILALCSSKICIYVSLVI